MPSESPDWSATRAAKKGSAPGTVGERIGIINPFISTTYDQGKTYKARKARRARKLFSQLSQGSSMGAISRLLCARDST